MTLLPLRALPVNATPDGPLTMRVEMRPSGSAHVYVRREKDKKTWLCKVRTVQEILAPSQQARTLDLQAVVMCLYNGVAYDTFSAPSYSQVPLELRRREVAFAQPETWTDDGYRLTLRVAIRGTTVAPSAPDFSGDGNAPMAAIPVVDISEEDVVFGLNFSETTYNITHAEPTSDPKRRIASLRSIGVAFPGSYLNFPDLNYHNFVKIVSDGVRLLCDGDRLRPIHDLEVTVDIVHAKDPALFALAINSQTVRVLHSLTYQLHPGGDLFHTIAQYGFKVVGRSLMQVVVLPGSAPALEGSSVTVREPNTLKYVRGCEDTTNA